LTIVDIKEKGGVRYYAYRKMIALKIVFVCYISFD